MIQLLLITIFIIHIILDAWDDAQIVTTLKFAHLKQSINVCLLLSIPYLTLWYPIDYMLGIYYILLRTALFDPIFNLFAKMPLFYAGVTQHWYSRLMRKIPPSFQIIYRISIIIGLILLIYNIK